MSRDALVLGTTAELMADIVLVERVPTIEEYRELRRLVGLSAKSLEANAPPTAYVSLIADGPAKDLYRQCGFSETSRVGM